MAVTGDIDLWAKNFPSEYIPAVIRLVLNSWQTFKFTGDPLEVPMTRSFCAHLRSNRNRSLDLFRIEWEPYEIDDRGNITGRIDLKFSQGFDEKVYFSIECKRLRVIFPSGFDNLASKYVTDGMSRYFNGQYAQGLDRGGMLGYVMDGRTDEAVQDVKKAIESHRVDLRMESDDTIRSSSCLSSEQVKETAHKYGPNDRFIIHHIFLPMSVPPNSN